MTLDQALIKGYSIRCDRGTRTTTITLINPDTNEEESVNIPTAHLEQPGSPAIHKALRKLDSSIDL